MAAGRKQAIYLQQEILDELRVESDRLDRSFSWLLHRAWLIAKETIKQEPAIHTEENDKRHRQQNRSTKE